MRNSPDYRTLKITVFNDDKKTDLIGECSLRLDRILVAGGGTDDGWRGLKCKDKYAGEILVELTFWDMRPTPDQMRKNEETVVFKEREREEKKEKDAPRKVGGAREMGFREKATKRRPLPSDPSLSREDLNQSSQLALEPVRATRKPRHSHQLPPQIHQSHNPYSEPPRPQRESRGSSSRPISIPAPRRIAVTPIAVNPGNGIYDPYGQDNHIGGEMLGRYDEPEDRDPHGQFEPPPPPLPPAHSRSYHPDGRHHSSTNIATQLVLPSQQRSGQHQRQKSQLRHYQSVPDWQFYQQQHASVEQRDESQRDIYDPRGPEQYGSSYPGSQNNFLPQEEYDNHPSPQTRSSRHSHLSKQTSYDGGMRHEDETPNLSYGSTPSNSLASLRNNDHDAPPPPPPPHARKPVPMRMEEPSWQIPQQHRQFQDQHLGLPSYDDLRSHGNPPNELFHEARAPSRGMDMSPTRNGVPLPPSLVPGIDPAVAEQMSERIEKERRLSFNGAELSSQLQIEAGPQSQSRQMQHVSNRNYHRPQVEEVQDVALYQPQLLPEDQVVERSVKKKQRSAPMVKPTPIHGDRDEPASVTASINKRNSMLVVPERKPLPAPEPKPLEGFPFSPDSFNVINPGPAVEAEAKKPKKLLAPGTNRVLDASDILPPESFAPEPELKKRAPPAVENHRKERLSRRSLSPMPPKKAERLTLPAPPPPVPRREQREPKSAMIEPPKEKNRLQKRLRNSLSMAILSSKTSGPEGSNRNRHSIGPGAMVMYNPESERQRQKDNEKAERERVERDSRALVPASGHENYGYKQQNSSRYSGMEVASYAPTSGRNAPPIPAKIPLHSGRGGQLSREDYLLSQEMSLINIGPSTGGGGRTRRGGY